LKEMKTGHEEVVENGIEVKFVNLREAND